MNEEKDKEGNENLLRMIMTGLLFIQAAAAYFAWDKAGDFSGTSVFSLMINWLAYTAVGFFFYVIIYLGVYYLDSFNLKGKWTGIIYFIVIPLVLFVAGMMKVMQ